MRVIRSFCSTLSMRRAVLVLPIQLYTIPAGPADRAAKLPAAPSHPACVIPLIHQGVDPMHKEQGHTVETPVEARAGFLDRPVLVVLVTSVALVCGLYALIYFGYFVTCS